ncbi:hypothetical protein YH64_029630 [Achromobacter sp. LC458]|uniref:hypothetical protein n=1 Tax=Achromobacter sp. LC458 TaxID=1120623 RepID=UPI0009E28149|nr:hypothetical protein [Achromobacter sp. LC458]TRM49358.1 hypothetical protein YH64_029630 [Achromobacter sp. LC458]
MNDHPYTYDRWATPDDPEFAVVRVDDLRKMERACQGIWAIARIVGNGVSEPNSADAQSLDDWITSNLVGGVEALCDHLSELIGIALDNPRSMCELSPAATPKN